MSEAQAGNESEGVSKQQAPAIDIEAITRKAAEEAARAVKETLASQPQKEGFSKEEVAKLIKEEQRRIVKSIAGEDESEGPNPIHVRFAKDPEGFVDTLAGVILEKVEEKTSSKEKAVAEMQTAFNKVMGKRSDILSDDGNKKLFLRFYQTTEGDSEAERMEVALKDYDLEMERRGLGDAEKRIKQALSLSDEGASGKASPSGSVTSQADILRFDTEELEERKREFAKKRGRLSADE